MKKTLIALLAVVALAAVANAEVTFAPSTFGVLNDAANSPITDGTLALVIDLDGDTNYVSNGGSATSWAWDAEDLVLGTYPISFIPTAGTAFASAVLAAAPAGYDTADHWYIVWYAAPFNALAEGPGEGVAYGAEDMGTVAAINSGSTLSNFAAGGAAVFTTVPEPTTMLLVLGGGLAALRRRTR